MVGTGMLNPAVAQVALSSVPPEQSGLAAGVNDMFRQAALAVGVAGLGALISHEHPQAYVDGLHDALWVGAALAVGVRGRDRAADSVAGAPEQVGEARAGPGELTGEVVVGDLDHVRRDRLEERVAERAVAGRRAVEIADALVEALRRRSGRARAPPRARPRPSP